MSTERPSALAELIRRMMAENDISQAELARSAKLSAATLSGILTGARGKSPDPLTLRNLARGLGIHERHLIAAWLQDLGLNAQLDGAEDDPATMTIIGSVQQMDPDERARFARIARAFLAGQ